MEKANKAFPSYFGCFPFLQSRVDGGKSLLQHKNNIQPANTELENIGKELGTLPTQFSKDFLPSAFETCGKSGQYHLVLMEAGLRLC